jgi:hypothetical protein
MTFKHSFLITTLLFTAFLYFGGWGSYSLVPKAHALYWEDDTPSNDPKEIKTRPTNFFLFDWLDDIDKNTKKNKYRDMDNHDQGPSVNNGARTIEIISSGVVGLAGGLFFADRLTASGSDETSNLFIGGALGFCAGIAIGALIMPHDFEVDQRAQIDFMKQRQAWLQDPVKLQLAQSFHSPQAAFSLKF